MSNIGKALGIDVLARKKEVSTTTEVHVLLHFYRDLLLVERWAVFHKATMNAIWRAENLSKFSFYLDTYRFRQLSAISAASRSSAKR